MSRGASEARAENSEGGTVLECVAHGHAIAVCQIVEAATRVVKWSEGNPGVELPFEQDSSQEQISAEQAGVPPAKFRQRLNSIGRNSSLGSKSKSSTPVPVAVDKLRLQERRCTC